MQDSLDKLKLEVQASENAVNSVFSGLETGLESLSTEIDTLQVSVDTTSEKLDTLSKQSQELNAELTRLKQRHQNLEQEVEQKGKDLTSLSDQLETLQHEKNTLESEIANKETTLEGLNSEINKLNSQIDDLKDKLLNAEDLKKEKVGSIEDQVEEIKLKKETKANQYAVLRHFLETDYESDSHYDVIKVIKQPGVSTIDQLVMASGVGRGTVEDTLDALETRGVIAVDGKKFSIEKDFTI